VLILFADKITEENSLRTTVKPSSETQGQLVGAGKSLNGVEKIRAKKSQEGTLTLSFSLPFRLFPTPTNYTGVPKDAVKPQRL